MSSLTHASALLCTLLCCAAPPADEGPPSAAWNAAQDPAAPPVLTLPRHPALSPDGSRVAFSHQGDVWTASVEDGVAVRLTAHGAYEGRPYWSHDGQWIAFLSTRHGNSDVFLMPAWGGAPTRVTWHSENEALHGWIDADRVLVGAQRDRRYSRRDHGAWIGYRDGRTPTVLGDWAMQRPALSADGRWLCYERGQSDAHRRAYRGAASSSLWVYDRENDAHTELTAFRGSDLDPMFSPDAETVYFLSDRACPGNEDGRDLGLWKVARAGGEPELVHHPGGASLRNPNISADGDHVVAEFEDRLVLIDTASGAARDLVVRGPLDPSVPDEYEKTVDRGASGLAISPDGESVAFVASGDVYVLRKHDEIQRCERVTRHPAPDGEPVWVEDGERLLFVSERDGNGEIYSARPADADDPFYKSPGFVIERVTETAVDESSLSLAPDGETLAWVEGLGKLVVGALASDEEEDDASDEDADDDGEEADDAAQDEDDAEAGPLAPPRLTTTRTITDGFSAPNYDWSPDSAWLVYSQPDNDFNNDVYLARVSVEGVDEDAPGVRPFNLTRHPDDDTGPRWSPDGRKIAFTSRRMMNDETDVWVAFLRAEDLERTKRERLEAEEAKKKAKKDEPGKKKDEPAQGEPGGSDPDAPQAGDGEAAADPISGTWEGMAEGPEPVPPGGLPFTLVLTMEGTAVEGTLDSAIFNGTVSGSWDAAASTLSLSFAIPEAPPAAGALKVADGTMSGTIHVMDEAYTLSAERVVAGAQEDDGDDDEDEKEEEEVEPVEIDWDDLHRRLRRLTRQEGNEGALGWDGDSEKIYFNASTGTRLTTGTRGETGLFTVEVFGADVDRVDGSTVGSFTRHGDEVFYVKGGRIVGRKGKATTYPFSVTYRERRDALRTAVIEQAWRVLDRNFYDPDFHGHDWAASLEKWRPIALSASTVEDYSEMVNWMLGEMNASHMGYYNRDETEAAEQDVNRTGFLGVLWDEDFAGPGRRVAEVLPGAPADRDISRLHPGDVVLAVNGEEYAQGDNWHRLMRGTSGEETFLRVQDAEGEEREVVIRPAGSLGGALYRRFEEAARSEVEESSDGRLGYVHIEAMGTGSLIEFERDLHAAGAGKDGLVIDVRENGGGWTTDMVLAMLMVRDHAITVPRGGGPGYPQGRRVFAAWDKPVVVLCNENSYSNAEIFSWSIKTLGRGPLVGKETYGAVISTGGTGLLDGSFVRIPFRGWYVNDEERTNMERQGCPPDYPVENLPGDYVVGRDRQLEKAVEVGLGLLD